MKATTAIQTNKKIKVVKSALILRLEIRRFGRVDRYYIDAKDSSPGHCYGFVEPNKATPFKSLAEIRRIIDVKRSKRCSFEILHVFDYQQVEAS